MKLLRIVAVVLVVGLVTCTLSFAGGSNTGKGGTPPSKKQTGSQTKGSIPDRRSPAPANPNQNTPPTLNVNLPDFSNISLSQSIIDRIKNAKK